MEIEMTRSISRDVAMVTDLWRVSTKIDTPRLHHVHWHSISDRNIATPVVALTLTMNPLRLIKTSRTLVQ